MCRNLTARKLVYHSRLECYACCFPPSVGETCPIFRAFRREGLGSFFSGLADEVNIGFDRDDAAIVAHLKELMDGFTAVFAVVQCALINVHTDEAVGQ